MQSLYETQYCILLIQEIHTFHIHQYTMVIHVLLENTHLREEDF